MYHFTPINNSCAASLRAKPSYYTENQLYHQLRKLIKYTLTLLDVNPQLKSLAFKLKDYLKPTFFVYET